MKCHWHPQALQNVFPTQHAIALLHVDKFDGKNGRRRPQFFGGQDQRRMVLLAAPPLGDSSNFRQQSERRITNHAEQSQIRIFRMEFAFRRRAVKYHAGDVIARSRANLADEFVREFCLLIIGHGLSSPAAACTTATGTAAAESSETSAASAETTTTEAATAPIAAAGTTAEIAE